MSSAFYPNNVSSRYRLDLYRKKIRQRWPANWHHPCPSCPYGIDQPEPFRPNSATADKGEPAAAMRVQSFSRVLFHPSNMKQPSTTAMKPSQIMPRVQGRVGHGGNARANGDCNTICCRFQPRNRNHTAGKASFKANTTPPSSRQNSARDIVVVLDTSWSGHKKPFRTSRHYFSSIANQRELSVSL